MNKPIKDITASVSARLAIIAKKESFGIMIRSSGESIKNIERIK